MENKIEVFILTHNRLNFLKSSLESILNQTMPTRVTVIDNCSSDGTEDYMRAAEKSFERVKYERNPSNIGYNGSFAKALALASAPFVMPFHDDDILHPDYIMDANIAIQKYPETEMVMCDGRGIPSSEMSGGGWAKPRRDAFYCKDRAASVAFQYAVGKMMFPSVVYKTENLRSEKLGTFNSIGKIYDKVLVCEALKNGATIVFRDKCYLRYRLHGGQDTEDLSTAVSPQNVANYLEYFRGQMSGTLSGRFMFAVKTFKVMRNLQWSTNMRRAPFRDFFRAVDAQRRLPLAARACLIPAVGGAIYALERLAVKIYTCAFPKISL